MTEIIVKRWEDKQFSIDPWALYDSGYDFQRFIDEQKIAILLEALKETGQSKGR